MGSPLMIVCKGTRQKALQMLCIEDDDIIETRPPDAPDEALHVRMLPRALRGDHDLFDAHVLDALPKGRAIDAVAEHIQYRGASSHGNTSTTCCVVHWAVGCSVILTCTTGRRSCARITSTKSTQ